MHGLRIRRWRAEAIACGLGALLWSGQAYAYCREVTGTPPANYDPADAGCYVGVDDAGKPHVPLYWRNECVSYSLQENASDQVKLADARRVARQAFDTWTAAPCGDDAGSPSISELEYTPPVSCDQVPSNEHNNPIIFRDNGWPYDSANALGFTTLTVDLVTGEIFGAAIEINSSNAGIVANVGDAGIPNGAYDLSTILTHEAGHFLGLAHSTDTDAVMYAFYHAGKTSLTPDDVNGICTVYPPDQTRNTNTGKIGATLCNATPPLGFLTTCGSADSGAFITASGPLVMTPGGGDPPCADNSGCSVGPGAGGRRGGLALCAVAALAVLARRRRLRSRVALGALFAVGAFGVRDAAASVSVSVLFDDLVQKATAVALVTPTEQRGVWEDGRIVTYTHVRIDRRLAGSIAGDAWLRALGGAVGTVGQLVEGQPTFDVGRPALLFMRPYVTPASSVPPGTWSVIEAAQGEFPVVPGAEPAELRLATAKDVGGLVPPAPPVPDARFARDVLVDRTVEEAVRQITSAWSRLHPK
jgi:Matrixin